MHQNTRKGGILLRQQFCEWIHRGHAVKIYFFWSLEYTRMSCVSKTLRLAIFFSMAFVPAWSQSIYRETWRYYEDHPLSDPSMWRQAYHDYAEVRLGPERRLANGISWRLLTDVRTGIAWPRITWMPNKQRLQTANEMLEGAHGASILDARTLREELEGTNRARRDKGWPTFNYEHATTQTAIDLAYASTRLLSVIDMEMESSEGNYTGRVIRGLTFDLEQRKVFRIEPCPGHKAAHGNSADDRSHDYKFRFGELLDVCEEEAYQKFRKLVLDHAERAARKADPKRDVHVEACLHHYIKYRPDVYFGEHEDIQYNEDMVLYLTFAGLAVHFTFFFPESDMGGCALFRTVLNPVIVPYRELQPFMMPGPWREELLALR
jgi:hypothetical protein